MGLTLDGFVWSRAAMAVVVCGVVVSLVPPPVVAQDPGWLVRSVHMDADLSSADGVADVVVRFELRAIGGDALPASQPLHFELLGFGDATVDRFATLSGDSVELWPTYGTHRAASVWVSRTSLDPDIGVMELSYRVDAAVVEDGGGLRARIPVLTGPPAAAGADGGFTARLRLPEGWIVSEGFPSGLRRDDDGAWSVGLQVTPSMVGFRGRSDGAWRPSVPLVIDLMTVLFLLGFSAVGWHHLSGVARRARA